ncbi:acetyltransferase [hydrothermal vent metagenome]|uniref:Acetyltransferase n=1 Tax=hydrothermal vent metagenome TaxID=652676 RepID=A0A3B1DWA2_9ZZZZ
MMDKDVNQFLESRFSSFTKKELDEYITSCNLNNNVLLKGIFVNDVHIGNIKLDIDNNHKFAFLGILVGDKSFHNKNVGKQAVLLMLHLAKEIKLNKILAGIYACNANSLSLFKSLGFVQSGLFKKHYIYNGEYVDKIIMEYIL